MLTMHKLTRVRRGDETGSVIVALIVVVVVAMGLVALFANVNSGLNLTRNDQNRTNAFQLANAGMDQAVYRIDTKTLPLLASGTYEPILADPVPAGCLAGSCLLSGFRESLVVGGSSFDFEATKTPPGQDATWTVRATGMDTDAGRRRRVVATVGADSLFRDAFATDVAFNLTGNQSSPEAYRSSVCADPRGRTDSPCIPGYPIPGRLSTNGTISGSAATAAALNSRWEGYNMYGRTNQADADDACMSGACGTAPKVAALTNPRPVQVLAMPTNPAPEPCPNGGNIGVNNQTTVLEGKDYTCAKINLKGTIVVGGTGNVRLWPTQSFSASAGSVINRAQRPVRFQVYYPKQQGNAGSSSNVCDSEIWALLFTPGMAIDCNGSHQPEIYGAVVAKEYSGTGNHFDFHWDMDSVNAVHSEKYVILDWRECPVTQTDC
jgi:Tfp pilus assembly protein PilX